MKKLLSLFLFSSLVFSAHAQVTFQKTYGGAQDDEFNYVQQTFDGGYILLGETNSFGAGGYDIYLVKTDSTGDTIWTKTYGGPEDDFGYEVQQSPDSGYIVIGSTHGNGMGTQYAYLIKTNIDGDTLWEKTYEPGTGGGHILLNKHLTEVLY